VTYGDNARGHGGFQNDGQLDHECPFFGRMGSTPPTDHRGGRNTGADRKADTDEIGVDSFQVVATLGLAGRAELEEH